MENNVVNLSTMPTVDFVRTIIGDSEKRFTSDSTGSDNGWKEFTATDSCLQEVTPLATNLSHSDVPSAESWALSVSATSELLDYGITLNSKKKSSSNGSTGCTPEEVEP